MNRVLTLLTALLGHDDYKVRDSAQDWLRAMRPDSEPVLITAANSPNPEVAFRASRALVGTPPNLDYLIFVGMKYQSWNYYVVITGVYGTGDDATVSITSVEYPGATFFDCRKRDVIDIIRECPQPPGTFAQRPRK